MLGKITKAAAVAAVIIGGAAMLAGSIDYELTRIYRAGLGLALLGGGYLLAVRSALVGALVERARQSGYDDGYADRCTLERRSDLRLVGSAGEGGPLDGAAQHLGREGDVRRGSERVG